MVVVNFMYILEAIRFVENGARASRAPEIREQIANTKIVPSLKDNL